MIIINSNEKEFTVYSFQENPSLLLTKDKKEYEKDSRESIRLTFNKL